MPTVRGSVANPVGICRAWHPGAIVGAGAVPPSAEVSGPVAYASASPLITSVVSGGSEGSFKVLLNRGDRG